MSINTLRLSVDQSSLDPRLPTKRTPICFTQRHHATEFILGIVSVPSFHSLQLCDALGESLTPRLQDKSLLTKLEAMLKDAKLVVCGPKQQICGPRERFRLD